MAPVSALLVVVLSALGIPASFVVIATLSIAGIGFGRSLRNGSDVASMIGGGHRDDAGNDQDPDEGAVDFDPGMTARVLVLQHTVPAFATFGVYVSAVVLPL